MAQSVDSEYELGVVDTTYDDDDFDEILDEVQIELLKIIAGTYKVTVE